MEVLNVLDAPLRYHAGVSFLGLRPVQVFFDLFEPYSLVLLLVGHALHTVIYRNQLLRSLIDLLTGDVIGVRAKSLVGRSLENLLPGRVFSRLSSLYNSYHLLLDSYRP